MTSPLGHDLWGIEDLDPGMREADGRLVLAQSIGRRYVTPRGRLVGDPNFGFDVRQFLKADITSSTIVTIQTGCAAEALKDERVVSASVTAVYTPDPGGKTGSIALTVLLEDSAGPFTFTLVVSAVTVQLLMQSAGP